MKKLMILALFLFVTKIASNVPYGPYTCDMFKRSEAGMQSRWLVSQEEPYPIVYMEITNPEGYTSKLQIMEGTNER